MKYRHSSRPNGFFTWLYTIFLAILNCRLVGWFLASCTVPYGPIYLAHVAILVLSQPFCFAICFIFSSIFYHTLGTEKNTVGRTYFKVYIKEPWRASGCAKYTW